MGLISCANCGQMANSEAGCQNCGANPQTGVVPESVLGSDAKAKALAFGARAEPVGSYTPWWARLLATWITYLGVLGRYGHRPHPCGVQTETEASNAIGWVFWCGLFAYFVVMEATIGKTLGKMVFGAHVLKLDGNASVWADRSCATSSRCWQSAAPSSHCCALC